MTSRRTGTSRGRPAARNCGGLAFAAAMLVLVAVTGACTQQRRQPVASPEEQHASVRIQPADFPAVEVECRTEPQLSAGECEAWAIAVLEEATQAIPLTALLLLQGEIGPGRPRDGCRAEFFDRSAVASGPIAVPCYVPTGG